MRYYAFILASSNVVGLVQGFGDNAIVDTSDDAYIIEVNEGQCKEGDVYDRVTGVFTTPAEDVA